MKNLKQVLSGDFYLYAGGYNVLMCRALYDPHYVVTECSMKGDVLADFIYKVVGNIEIDGCWKRWEDWV